MDEETGFHDWFHQQHKEITSKIDFQHFNPKCNQPLFKIEESISSINESLIRVDETLTQTKKYIKEINEISSETKFTAKASKKMCDSFADHSNKKSFLENATDFIISTLQSISNWLFILFSPNYPSN